MKSEHRHELKTNELAEWLGNLPQWTKENLVTIIIVSVAVIVLAGVYVWRGYSKNVLQARERVDFTRLVNQVSVAKMQIVQGREQDRDLSFALLQPAKALEAFAQGTKSKPMAALALIKQAQALRAELHYGNVEEQYSTDQLNKAKDSYSAALARSTNNPALAAAAEFGLGLCEEELGNFEQAQQMYRQIVANADYEGIVTVTQAQRRLKVMVDYEQKIAFKPDPTPKPAAAQRKIDIRPTDVRMPENIIPPFNFNRPLDLSMFAEANEPAGNEE
ncbi:MAG: tetratricopeptide repeat protein [Planctomycetota bacterium]|jgi:tetratricopeptide (TPR) repeat protein